MSRAILVKIDPVLKRVLPIGTPINPAVMQRLLKSERLGGGELARIPGIGIICWAGAYKTVAESAILPRWQIGPNVIAGEALLFGRNAAGKAANCPIGADKVKHAVEWLDPLCKLGENLARLEVPPAAD